MYQIRKNYISSTYSLPHYLSFFHLQPTSLTQPPPFHFPRLSRSRYILTPSLLLVYLLSAIPSSFSPPLDLSPTSAHFSSSYCVSIFVPPFLLLFVLLHLQLQISHPCPSSPSPPTYFSLSSFSSPHPTPACSPSPLSPPLHFDSSASA